MKRTILFFISTLLLTSISCKEAKKETQKEQLEMVISDSLKWSDRMAQSIMKRHPKAVQTGNPNKPSWNYKIGLLLFSFEKLHQETGNNLYYNYVKEYAETEIDSSGTILSYNKDEYNIDMINSGKILFSLYDKTQDTRYFNALKTLREQLKGMPRTNSGGFWHKKIYPNQMWLDGLYMGSPFYAQYNTRYENGDQLDDIVKQFRLVYQHTYDEETGMLLHAWDESKQMDWADKETGKSPNFWSRSMGWFMMAMVDVLDFIPQEHPGHQEIVGYLNQLSSALGNQQDVSGLWYQVPNFPTKEGNYLESSSTCMFIYAYAKGVAQGYLPEEYQSKAESAFNATIEKLITVDTDGEIHINQVCGSAGLGGNPYRDGSFEYYIGEPIKTDDLHGLGPFILAALALDQ
ncbi:MAG: glycosyl hydrolase family 88 [Flavobacteriaceae bacterium]|nr:MAG: glycosyl hydrolase family 88 [Flavobacteriaceae bacterium]